jgi:hypothetical protein
MWGGVVEMESDHAGEEYSFRKSHYGLTKTHISSFFAPLRLRVNPLHPHGARGGLIDLTRRRKGAKRMMRESGDFEEHSPVKKPRKSQEVDTESVYSSSLHDMKKWHNQSTTAVQEGGQARGESSSHD